MKLGILLYTLGCGGTERAIINLIKNLIIDDKDLEVDLLYMRDGELREEAESIERVKCIKLKSERASKCVEDISQYIDNERPDAIISAGRHINITLLKANKLSKNKTKTIITEHGNPKMAYEIATNKKKKIKVLLTNMIAKNMYKKADKIVAVSKALKDILEEEIKNIKVDVIYNPVINDRMLELAKLDVEEDIFNKKQRPIILSIGRLTYEKNHELLIDSFKILIDKGINADLVLIGDGELKDRLEQKIKDNQLNDYVHLYGYRENPYAYLNKSDAFVLSSITESLSMVLVEALKLKVPTISTDCPVGPREVLNNGEYGILCNQTKEEMADAIECVINKKYDRKLADENYINQFNSEEVSKKYMKLIKMK